MAINVTSFTTARPFITGAQLWSGPVTPTQFNLRRAIPAERHSRATMARLNRTRPRSHQHASRVGVSPNWQPSVSLEGSFSD